MEESVTYQEIVEIGEAKGLVKGRVEEARAFLLRLGRKRFGEPNARTLAHINQLSDPEVIEALGERLLVVSSWKELLPPRSSGKKS